MDSLEARHKGGEVLITFRADVVHLSAEDAKRFVSRILECVDRAARYQDALIRKADLEDEIADRRGELVRLKAILSKEPDHG